MSGLDDLNANTPTGLASPTQGDDELRAIKARVKEYAYVEHAYDGKHKFPIVSILPANDSSSSRLVIKTTVGLLDELYYDTGAAWVKITRNNDIADALSGLSVHAASNPIDHAAGSIVTATLANDCVTANKIGNGAIQCHHMDAAQAIYPDFTTAPLVNGSDLDATWHTHSQYDLGGGGSSGVNFLSSVLLAASGSGDIAWTTINANTLSGGVIPVTAKAVMLSINISLINNGFSESFTGVNIYGRKTVGSPSIIMIQYRVPTAVSGEDLLSSQSICPMTGTDGKFDVSVTNTAANVGTWDISIFGYYL